MHRTRILGAGMVLLTSVSLSIAPAWAQTLKLETAQVELYRDGAKPAKTYHTYQVLDLKASPNWLVCPFFDSTGSRNASFKFSAEAFLAQSANPLEGTASLGTVKGTVKVVDGFGADCIPLTTPGTDDYAIIATKITTKKTRKIIANGQAGFWGTASAPDSQAAASGALLSSSFGGSNARLLTEQEIAQLRSQSD